MSVTRPYIFVPGGLNPTLTDRRQTTLLHPHDDVVQPQRRVKRRDRVDAAVGVGDRPRRRQRRGGRGRDRGRTAAAAASAAAGQAERDARAARRPASLGVRSGWAPTCVCNSATDSPSIDRNTNPMPTPSRASISCRPIENVSARLAETPYSTFRLVAVAPWNTPRLPGVMGKSCTRFDARKTTAAAPIPWWIPYADEREVDPGHLRHPAHGRRAEPPGEQARALEHRLAAASDCTVEVKLMPSRFHQRST